MTPISMIGSGEAREALSDATLRIDSLAESWLDTGLGPHGREGRGMSRV
jgi:hypothetical protein